MSEDRLSGKEQSYLVANVTFEKKIDIKVLSPIDYFFALSADEISEKSYLLLAEMVKEVRTTLGFTNTRSAAKRVVFHLKKKF